MAWGSILKLETVQYALVPPLHLLSVLVAPEPFDLRADMTQFQFVAFCLSVGFWGYTSFRSLVFRESTPWSILVHHGGLVVGSVVFVASGSMFQFVAWVGALQFNSCLHEIFRAVRHLPQVTAHLWARLMTIELVAFVLARFVVFTPFAIYLIVDAFTVEPQMLVFACVAVPFLPALTVLHVIWFKATVRRWRRARLAAQV